MTAPDLISCDAAVVKAALVRLFTSAVDPLVDAALTGALTPREAERRSWQAIVHVGAMLLSALLAALCRCEAARALGAEGIDLADVTWRLDGDYWAKIATTFGHVAFPWFAYRDARGSTHTPARRLFPLHPLARVSEVLLEWESALAADHPFRKAAEALLFFSHGAADVEDTTIERHAVLVGAAIPRNWLYQTPAKIASILRDHAVLDRDSGRPFLQVSTDAHALRMFPDDTWKSAWKMVNGLRMWCINRLTGETIHLGGEFINGDCHALVARLHELAAAGILPFDGKYGDIVAQIVIPTDGLDWIAEHVVPLYPTAIASLDPYHVVEQVADAARKALPKSKVNAVIAQARKSLGVRDHRERTYYRKGNRRQRFRRRAGADGSGDRLLAEVLEPLVGEIKRGKKRVRRLVAYVERNRGRMHYGELRARGAQIGSGAMESMHRTGSQVRLKRAGCRWTPEVAEAILNLRMLALAGRWNEYWATGGVAQRIAAGARQ